MEKQLAKYFSALVRAEFTAEQLAEINRRNATPAYIAACATHDYCDANSLIYGAYCAMNFAEPDTANEDHAELMNKAWNIARKNGFA